MTEKPVAPIGVRPLGSKPDLLRAPERPGWRRRWARNTEEDVERMQEVGYVVVKRDSSPFVRRDMILMETPEVQYREREKAKVAERKARRRTLAQRAVRETDQLVAGLGKDGVKRIGGVDITGGGASE